MKMLIKVFFSDEKSEEILVTFSVVPSRIYDSVTKYAVPFFNQLNLTSKCHFVMKLLHILGSCLTPKLSF
jgi:hypothetical protein